MQRWISVLAAVLCVQLLIAGALAARKSALTSAPPDSPFVSAPIRTADRIVLEGQAPDGKAAPRVELARHGGAWVVHSDFDVPAAPAKVDDLLTRIASLRRGLPIADTAEALDRFKVGTRDYSRRLTFSLGGRTLETLYFGESAGLHKADARTQGEHAVYTVGIATYDLPVDPSRWVADDLLQVGADTLAKIDVEGAHRSHVILTRAVAAGKAPGPWSATGLARGRTLDASKAAALAHAITAMSTGNVLGTQPQADWQLDHPVATLTLEDGAGKAVTWTLAKPKSGDFVVLKSSDHPWYFSLMPDQAQPLIDAGTEDGLAAAPAVKSVTKSAAKKASPGEPHAPKTVK